MLTTPNYPLRFEPILKDRLWGGRRLETVLGRSVSPSRRIGESWEISDHGGDVSVVANGPLRGSTLTELVGRSGESRFPLLVKWIDAAERLSVQVHPPDGHKRLPPGECGKSECWWVLDADPNAEIYLGLKRGIDRAALERELARGAVDRCLNVFAARPGDFFFVPAGTVHSIGAGVLLAEIQQSSDTTFRLFDWNRVDAATGRSRELHVAQALECIDFTAAPPSPQRLAASVAGPADATLIGPGKCRQFNVAWRRFSTRATLGEAARWHILVCLDGHGKLTGGGEVVPIHRGDCMLLPRGEFACEPQQPLEFLDGWVP